MGLTERLDHNGEESSVARLKILRLLLVNRLKPLQWLMKNKLRTCVFVLGIFVFQASIAHATDYNYLPADVGIKQKEALSALEYRLKSLESQLSNNPSGILNIYISNFFKVKGVAFVLI